MKSLNQEKSLIATGNKQLAEMVENIKKKLGIEQGEGTRTCTSEMLQFNIQIKNEANGYLYAQFFFINKITNKT